MRRLALAALLALPGCYSSATSARSAQTESAEGWVCYSRPAIECPDRADRRCTGWDRRWLAHCPDTQRTFACRFVGSGSRVECGELEPR